MKKFDLKLSNDELIKLGGQAVLSVLTAMFLRTPEDNLADVATTACAVLGATYLARGAYSATSQARSPFEAPADASLSGARPHHKLAVE